LKASLGFLVLKITKSMIITKGEVDRKDGFFLEYGIRP